MEIKQFKKAFPYLLKASVTPFLWGSHGIGKSQAVRQWCDENGYDMIDLRLGTQEVGDLLGLADFLTDEDGQKVATKFMTPDWFPTDPHAKAIIFLDEINRARRDVLQAVFQLVLDRRLHQYRLPANVHVIAASNPNTEDYIVADIGDQAFMDRFCHIKLTPTVTEWVEYAEDRKFDRSLLNFIRQQPELLDGHKNEFNIEVLPSRRSWEAVNRLMTAETPQEILQELCYGLIGKAATVAFIDSISNSERPLTAKDILESLSDYITKVESQSDPKTGGRPDLLKVTCDEIKKTLQKRTKMKTSEAENLLRFMKKIPSDICFNLARDLYVIDHVRDHLDSDNELTELLESKVSAAK